MRDTIFAPVTAPGRSAVAIVRVSGPEAGVLLDRLCGRRPAARVAALRAVRAPSGELIDQALVLWFEGPESFTGEDVFELQLHGGPAIIEGASTALLALGAKLAEPGEFTRRAFEAGRLELSQAEAIADLVDAETAAQRAQALSQLSGALRDRYDRWRALLIEASAFLEAQIDFPDEEVPPEVAARARAPLRSLLAEIEAASADDRGERVRDGLRIALVGRPNAGKSSLFNALIGREAAIVTPIPGTTRDIIEASLVIDGYKVLIADTAGLRETVDVVEAEGVRRALAWAETADLRLHLLDSTAQADKAEDLSAGDLIVLTKTDLALRAAGTLHKLSTPVIAASALAPGGLDDLWSWLLEWVRRRMAGREFPAITQRRHRDLLLQAANHLERALQMLSFKPELAAEDVRLGIRALERLSGRIAPDDVLERVFSSFCIGK